MSTSTATNSVTPGNRVHVVLGDRIDEVLAHAVPAENLFGEGGTDEQQRELVGEERGHRNERRAQAVLDRARADGSGPWPGGAQEIAAEHVQHRVALVAAVEGDGDHDQHERRQHEMRDPVQRCRPTTTGRARRDFPGRVEELRPSVESEQVVQADAGVLEQDGQDDGGNGEDDEREHGDEPVGRAGTA